MNKPYTLRAEVGTQSTTVIEKEFDTKAERDAYLEGLNHGTGWMELRDYETGGPAGDHAEDAEADMSAISRETAQSRKHDPDYVRVQEKTYHDYFLLRDKAENQLGKPLDEARPDELRMLPLEFRADEIEHFEDHGATSVCHVSSGAEDYL